MHENKVNLTRKLSELRTPRFPVVGDITEQSTPKEMSNYIAKRLLEFMNEAMKTGANPHTTNKS